MASLAAVTSKARHVGIAAPRMLDWYTSCPASKSHTCSSGHLRGVWQLCIAYAKARAAQDLQERQSMERMASTGVSSDTKCAPA